MNKNYSSDHRISKLVICHIVIILITVAQLTSFPISLLLNAGAVYSWFFGVNFIAHVVETIKHHKHNHPWV